MELIAELVAQHQPKDTVACFRGLNRASRGNTFLQQIQAKAFPRYVAELAKRGRLAELEDILACPHPAIQLNRALVQAVYHNQLAVVERLLRDPRANPSAFQNEAIWVACHFSDINIVECLLRDPRVDPSANEHRALYEACGRGNVAIVDRLLQDPRVTPNVTRIGASSPLSWAACSNRLEVVARLLEDPRTDVSDPILLQDACRSVEMTNLFIQRGLEPTARTLLQACGHGTLEVVQFLAQFVPLTENMRDVALASGYRDKAEQVLSLPHLEITDNSLICAVRGGHPDIVRRVLDQPHINPMAWFHNFPDDDGPGEFYNVLVQAVWGPNKVEMVRMLLADPRVDPSAYRNLAFREAFHRQETEILKLLLAHPLPRNRTFLFKWALSRIARNPQPGSVHFFTDISTDYFPVNLVEEALRDAAGRNNQAGVRVLLQDPRINPSAAFQTACQRASREVVSAFLADPRVDPHDGLQDAGWRAHFRNEPEALDLILRHHRTRPDEVHERAPRYPAVVENPYYPAKAERPSYPVIESDY